MRFEIKAGGWFLIVVGLLGLSVIVFALGLFAGYDMARNTVPESPQTASVYPLPNPPAEAAKASAKSSDEVASTQPAPKPVVKAKASGIDSGASSLSMDKNSGPVNPPPARIASAPVAAPKAAPAPETEPDEVNPPVKPEVANTSDAETSGGHHGKPFNIQIDAVMDRSNAEQMTTRLQKLGYHAFMVPTDISGQTWWRVRVGPYQSQEEASAAEQELRAKYKDTYAP
ncbi:MAG TPA: SPOR domain-containing protein [Candidatus Binataceae bacterium]|nr:SPOR domain-containing protein [Candidatus Binataceae bacterium]